MKKGIGQFRHRIKFKANSPTSDGAGGYTDDFDPYDLESGVFELWAAVEVKQASRELEQGRTVQVRKYKIIARSPFGYSMTYVPKKNMKVEIVSYTTNPKTNKYFIKFLL